MDIVFLLGKQAAKSLIGWAIGGSWSRSDSAGLAAELFGNLASDLGALRADLTERLDRIETLTEHLVGAHARAAIGYGLRHVADAESSTSTEERFRAMERAQTAFYEAAELARDAMKVQPAMAIVAGDAELLVAASLLTTNRLDRVSAVLASAEAAYLRGVESATAMIVAIDDEMARAHFMTHAPTSQRLMAKLGSSNGTWWPSLRELQSPLAPQLVECIRRLNVFRSNLKPAWAPRADCQLLVPVLNNSYSPHFDDHWPLTLGHTLQSLRLATRPLTPSDPVFVGDHTVRLVRSAPPEPDSGQFETAVELAVTAPKEPFRFRLLVRPTYSYEPLTTTPGQEARTLLRMYHGQPRGWLQVVAAPLEWPYTDHSSPPPASEVAFLPVLEP